MGRNVKKMLDFGRRFIAARGVAGDAAQRRTRNALLGVTTLLGPV